MIRCAVYQTATGEIRQINQSLDTASVVAVIGPDQSVLEVDDLVSDHTHYVTSGAATPKPASPNPIYTWDWPTHTWVDTRAIADVRAAKNQSINAARLAANQSTFPFAGKIIQCGAVGRSDIDGINGAVTLTGALPPGFPGGWKALDNTFVSIPDKATWTSFYFAMVAQGQANWAQSQSLKAQVAAATTNQQVDAITWTS